MKSLKVTSVQEIRNELNKYKKGKKFDINQFNQLARLAWLGKLSLQPLDPEDADTTSLLVHVDYPDQFQNNFIQIDQELLGHIFIVDGEQGEALLNILRQGVQDRAYLLSDLNKRDFYFSEFYRPKPVPEAPSEASDSEENR
jgi:hypothetical protein